MAGEELARRAGAEAVNHVVDTGGDADLGHHLAQQRRGLRGLFRWLHDDRVAAGKRRPHLPRHEKQRQVPRTDDRNHALRYTQRVVDRARAIGGAHREEFAGHILHHIGKDLEVGRTARNVQMAGQTHRLARIGYLGLQEVVEPAVDLIGDRIEHLCALGDIHPTPRPLECGPRCCDRRCNLGRARFAHQTNQSVVDRRAVLERLAGAGNDELVGNEMGSRIHAG